MLVRYTLRLLSSSEERGRESTNLIINEGKRGGKLFSESVIVVSSFSRLCRVGKMHIRFTCNPFHVVCARVCVLQLDNGAQKCIGSILMLDDGLPDPEK